MKNIIKLIIFTMLIAFALPNYASAQESKQSSNQTDTMVEPTENQSIQGDSIEDIKITGQEDSDSVTINVDSYTDKEQSANAQIEIDTNTNKNNVVEFSSTDENGNIVNENYDLEIVELNEEAVKAKLINSDTSEEILIDSTKVQATVIPVIVGLIVRAGLQYAIKHYGKKLAMQALIDLGVSQITKAYGGTTKNAKNGKGKVITIPNKKQTIVIRLMEAGSGGRKEAYWRMSVGNKSLNRAGNFSSNASETHMTLQESSIGTIIKLIKKFKK